VELVDGVVLYVEAIYQKVEYSLFAAIAGMFDVVGVVGGAVTTKKVEFFRLFLHVTLRTSEHSGLKTSVRGIFLPKLNDKGVRFFNVKPWNTKCNFRHM